MRVPAISASKAAFAWGPWGCVCGRRESPSVSYMASKGSASSFHALTQPP